MVCAGSHKRWNKLSYDTIVYIYCRQYEIRILIQAVILKNKIEKINELGNII